jgi:hypothetical protein
MAASLNWLAAREHIANVHRAADGRRAARAARRRGRRTAVASSAGPAATVRFAQPDEAGALRRLAQLDDAPQLAGEILVATVGADVVAALSLQDGRVVADPFVLTSDAVELLQLISVDLRPVGAACVGPWGSRRLSLLRRARHRRRG